MIHEVFPYLCVHDAAAAISFYAKAFGAREKFRLTEPGGRVGHAEIELGGVTVMLADEFPEVGFVAPAGHGAVSFTIHLHVDNADDFIRTASAHGVNVEREPQDHFYGERSGTIRDPFGHRWLIGHHIEDVPPEEMQRRYTEALVAQA